MTLAAQAFARHVLAARFEDLSDDAVDQARVFILDTIGVGIAGSTAYGADELAGAGAAWGTGGEAAVWGRRERAPAPTAALLNAFGAHCQEYDCVHEGAVLHPMATALAAALAFADRQGGVSGQALITAVAVAVDVASGLGIAATSAMRFFRPSTAGGFGATAAVGRLMALDEAALVGAFGLQYAQTSGTLQPHVEGSVSLPLQVGFNARAGLQSADLAAAGLRGPTDVFEGPYGYLPLMERTWDLAPVLAALGHVWRIAELSHKPYPAGRATHAGVEALIRLRAEHPFELDEVDSITIIGPPITARLCGRLAVPHPTPNYARLCMPFVAAKVLQHGTIDLAHYRGAELTDPDTYRIAQRIQFTADGSTDPNALVPVTTTIRLKGGTTLEWRCDAMLASPTRRLTRAQHLAKFRRCCDFAHAPLPESRREAIIAMVDTLDTLDDVRSLTALLAPP